MIVTPNMNMTITCAGCPFFHPINNNDNQKNQNGVHQKKYIYKNNNL